ncbi:MAG: hypothetical protein JWM44_4397 [Bacilli bacterium]|nr:hypothetical protein [Bacilli bacterium]
MITKAIGKIQAEMDGNKANSYIQAVGGFLLTQVTAFPADAEKIMTADKTIAKSFDEMRKVAEKKKVGNCAFLSPQEGFDFVLKYFGIKGAAMVSDAPTAVSAAAAIIPAASNDNPNAWDFDVKLDDYL